jgi:hypothetical protein
MSQIFFVTIAGYVLGAGFAPGLRLRLQRLQAEQVHLSRPSPPALRCPPHLYRPDRPDRLPFS